MMKTLFSRKALVVIGVTYLVLLTVGYWAGLKYVDLSFTKGRLIWGDGFFYYEWLPTFVSGHPLNFCPARAAWLADGLPSWNDSFLESTRAGKCITVYGFGWAILVSPFFLIAHLISLAASQFGYTRLDGYGFIYESITVYGAVLFGFFGCVFLYKIGRLYFGRAVALCSAAAIFFASNAVYYATIQATMSHVTGMFCIGGATYYWLRISRDLQTRHIWKCAVFVALGLLVRPQLLLVGAFITAQVLWQYRSVRLVIPLVVSLAVAALFEVFVWYLVFHKLVFIPQGAAFMSSHRPMILEVMFSLYHGLFVWHPIYLVGVVGFLWYRKLEIQKTVVLSILGIMVAQLYVNSTALDWWAGNSFGSRRFVDILPLFYVGFLCVTSRVLESRLRYLWYVVAVFLIIWNCLFLIQYRFGYIPRKDTITIEQLFIDKFRLNKLKRSYL